MGLVDRAVSRIRRVRAKRTAKTDSRDSRDSRTAEVHLYFTLWRIPKLFGGMTASIMRRAAGFINHGDPLSVTILTFDHRQDAKAGKGNLEHNGYANVGVRNMWDEIARLSDEQLDMAFAGASPESAIPDTPGDRPELSDTFHQVRDTTNRIVREEHLRDDGTVLFTDARPTDGCRRIVIHDAHGSPIIEVADVHDFYRQWIQMAVDKEPAVLVADPGIIANIVHSLGPRRFKLVHFLHVSHLEKPDGGIFGEYVKARVDAFRDFDQFDLVAVQTQKQIDDMARLGLDRKRMRLIPSEISPDAIAAAATVRDESKGIVAGRLVDLKQTDHAITAAALAREASVDVKLDICGTGPERDHLQNQIHNLDLSAEFRLRGHVEDLTDRFARVSFSLLTSKHEGLGLAIVESMAAGCIPIVYDIKYGPGGIITHGVNGYLVPANDVDAMAAQIVEFLKLSEHAKQAMREAAVTRARDYLPESSYSRWKAALEQPVATRTSESSEPRRRVRVRDLEITPGTTNGHLAIVFADRERLDAPELQLIVSHRSTNTFFQAVSTMSGRQPIDDRAFYTFSLSHELFTQSIDQIFDVYVREVGATWASKMRLRLPASFTRVDSHDLRWYRTQHGNLSVKVLNSGARPR